MTTASAFNGSSEVRLHRQPDGCVLVSLRSPGPARLEATSVRADQLRAALDEVAPAGSYTRTDEPRGHDYTPCTHEVDSEHWQARWKEAADQRDARDAAADRWKEVARRLARQRNLARLGRDYYRRKLNATTSRAERTTSQLHEALDEQVRLGKERDAAKAEAAMCQTSLNGQIRRAEQAEQERDMAREDRQELQERLAIQQKMAEQPRPLTPDDITDEMVERARDAQVGATGMRSVPGAMRAILTAALTEPPTRSYWAADIEAVIRGNDGGVLDPTVAATIADRVAEFMAEQENRSAGDGS